MPPPFGGSAHLAYLLGAADRLAILVGGGAVQRREEVSEQLTARCAVASLQLDGSSISRPPPRRRLEELADLPWRGSSDATAAGGPRGGRPAGWADTLHSALADGRSGGGEPAEGSHAGTDEGAGAPDGTPGSGLSEEHHSTIEALEYLGVRSALCSDDLAERLLREPRSALAALHRRLTRGLIDPWQAGRPRRTAQAVHDGSVGRVVYFAPTPTRAREGLDRLCAWVIEEASEHDPVVASGILHLELLRLHPFESANGRLARTAGRLLLRARGGDPDRLAAAELVLARDPLGTYEEVARTTRRGDCTIWLERWGEAVTGGLRTAAARLGLLDGSVPERAERFVAQRLERRFDLSDYTTAWGVDRERARAELRALIDAGRVRTVPGSRGLVFEIAGLADRSADA